MKKILLILFCFPLIILTSCSESKSKLNGNVEEVVQMIVSNALMINQDLNNNTHLIYDLGADELDLIEIAIEIEYQYNILITDQELEALLTIGDLINFVEYKSANCKESE